MRFSLSPFAPENLVSRDGFGSPVPPQPAYLHTQTEYGAYLLRDSSRVPRRPLFIYFKHHTPSGQSRVFGSRICVPLAFTAESPPAQPSKPQGSSRRMLPWQVTMDQVICVPLSHNHYWFKMGKLKVPAELHLITRRCLRKCGTVEGSHLPFSDLFAPQYLNILSFYLLFFRPFCK